MRSDTRLSALFDTLEAGPGFEQRGKVRGAIGTAIRVSGVTVHLVTPELDGGPIILQRPVAVLEDDSAESLAARILVEEHRLYPTAVSMVLDGTWRIDGRRFVRAKTPV